MRILTPARVTVLMLLVVAGLIAAYIAKNLMASNEEPPKVETRTVPMAVADLKPGTIVTEAHLGVGRMPVSQLNDYPGMLLENRAIVGRMVRKPIRAGTPILSDQLYQPGEIPPLDVKAGMRAVAVNLSGPAALVDGRIAPGQYVDVHLTPNMNSNGNDDRFQGGLTLTLFQGVRVLAINSQTAQTLGRSSNTSVTLELTPGQANVMILAASKGEITLTYNPEGAGKGGVGINREDRATLNEILGLSSPKDMSFYSESYRGSSRTMLRFRNGRRVDSSGNFTRKSGTSSGRQTARTAQTQTNRQNRRTNNAGVPLRQPVANRPLPLFRQPLSQPRRQQQQRTQRRTPQVVRKPLFGPSL